ncbi:hypothetical protein [Aquimarina sp. 2201CG5-10]|uniref:hypothetical protein n=1 Tax=Aquimarina callyspongiae TaxID=3098150 RepID=UPI002AB338A7|nr:hypothetical protein [Aquimarina sp. 2201CG5-10]MDY8137414.1 hypothetical protein [Aquimarina sp. 2201CG5-10]
MTTTEFEERTRLKLSGQTSNELINYMKVLANNEDNTRSRLKELEVDLSEAVKLHQDEQIVEKRIAITNLLEEKLSQKSAQDLSYAIFCDTRHLDPNWWAVNELIGKSTAKSIWGFKWSVEDKKCFLDFINFVESNPKEFNFLAQKVRESETSRNEYKSKFEGYIARILEENNILMSQELTSTLIDLSCYPCSAQELERLFVELLEPITW